MELEFSHKDSARNANKLRLFKYIVSKECIAMQIGPKSMVDAKYDRLMNMCERYCSYDFDGFKPNELAYLNQKHKEMEDWYKIFTNFREQYVCLSMKLW